MIIRSQSVITKAAVAPLDYAGMAIALLRNPVYTLPLFIIFARSYAHELRKRTALYT